MIKTSRKSARKCRNKERGKTEYWRLSRRKPCPPRPYSPRCTKERGKRHKEKQKKRRVRVRQKTKAYEVGVKFNIKLNRKIGNR